MFSIRTSRIAIVAVTALLVALPACQSTPVDREEGADQARQSAPTAQPTAEATADPRSDRSRAGAAAFKRAIAGLSFDTGYVTFKQPPAKSDALFARQHLTTGDTAMSGTHKTAAIAAYADAVRAAPDMAEAYHKLGDALLLKGKNEMACASYNSAIRLEPKHTEHRLSLAQALGRTTNRVAAINAMEQVLELDPNNGEAHERLAVWYYYEQDYPTAWSHVFAARDAEYPLPPQFITLLEQQMPEPQRGR